MNLNTNNAESVLRLHDLFVNNATYASELNICDRNKIEKEYSFKCRIQKNDDFYKLFLAATVVTTDKNAELILEICGVFSFIDQIDVEVPMNDLLTQNTIALMFPYLRTYVSNFSSMTDMGTVTLPVFNIVKAFSQSKKDTDK